MICFILNIFFIILYVFVVVYTIRKRKYIDKNNDYEFVTSYPSVYCKIIYICLGVSLLLHLISIIMFLINKSSSDIWIPFSMGTFFGLMIVISFYDLFLDYEAIKGDYLYISRPFRLKKINIFEIKKIVYIKFFTYFYNEDGKCLFMMDSSTIGIGKIQEYIKEKNKDIIITDYLTFTITSKKTVPNANDIYEDIGKEHKEKLPKKIKNLNYLMIIAIPLILLVGYLLFDVVEKPGFGLLIFLSIICVVVCVTNAKSKYKKELERSDLSIGKQYYYFNKKVIGGGGFRIQKRKNEMVAVSILFIIFGLLLGIIFIFSKPVDKSELELVSGKVEYVTYENVGKTYNILIYLDDDSVEYRISGTALNAIEKEEFFGEVKEGDTLYLNVSKKYIDDGIIDKTRTHRTYVYEVYTNEKYYLSFDQYLEAEEDDEILGVVIISVFVMIGIALIIYYKWYRKYNFKNMGNEYISVYDNRES